MAMGLGHRKFRVEKMEKSFDQVEYWIKRHQRFVGDPRSVGNAGKSLEENLKGEQKVRALVTHAAELLKPAATVLDLGCGYGRVADCFYEQGYTYHGVDVSIEATLKAKRDHPRATFATCDLLTWDSPMRFDVVAALYLFVNFVDDAAWLEMLEKSVSWLAKDGVLLIADDFPTERTQSVAHAVARSLSEYESALGKLGFGFDQNFEARLKMDSGISTKQFKLARRI